jgi:hypothetical protein
MIQSCKEALGNNFLANHEHDRNISSHIFFLELRRGSACHFIKVEEYKTCWI